MLSVRVFSAFPAVHRICAVLFTLAMIGMNFVPDCYAQATPGGGAVASEAKDGAKPKRPIQALLVTGGCCHDYDRQKLILPKGISARADVQWTVVHQGGTATNSKIALYDDPNWAEGFDVVVHNECFADVKEMDWVDRVLAPHRKGLPAVLIHCAMHCYRTGSDPWFEFCGLQSPGHGPHYPFTVENVKPTHPIMKQFGDQWNTPNEELYHSIKIWPTATVLGQAKRKDNNEPQVCIWTNQYRENTRVFATTIGHYNETMADPKYLDMLSRGLLWAVHGDNAPEIRITNEEKDAEIKSLVAKKITQEVEADDDSLPGECCGKGNLFLGKAITASSEETGKKNFAKKAVDGKLSTRWCASGAQANEWIQIDLGKPESIGSMRIHWEQDKAAYKYKVEGSLDSKEWKTIVNESQTEKPARIAAHEFAPVESQYVRITYLGAKSGSWGSIFECEAYSDKLPELPATAVNVKAPAATLTDVKAPKGFDVRMFASPPQVNYPVCLTSSVDGQVFVGVDEQGSLGKKPGRGRILRCVDNDGDGQADSVNVFAEVDHPRGLIYDQGNLWVLHPPTLSLFIDKDLDGVSDESKVLVSGISTEQVGKRGADHTTNGIRMGIDGWIYIAVGDYGFNEAKGTDGRILRKRGGGIARVRPDGTDLEIYAWGLRNVLDASIDPYLNLFTRDNTNDGGGWNVRVSHIIQGANYGYPSLYINFADEIMPPLADYGGGSGCGSMYVYDTRWPKDFGSAAYTCDWGTSQVYIHRLPAVGATFDPHQESFVSIPRPTDIDIDGSGRMYVSSWKNGGFDFSDPNVGFVAQITPHDFVAKPFPTLSKLSDRELISLLKDGNSVPSLHIQREVLRRGDNKDRADLLESLAANKETPLAGRIAAIFTLKQLQGVKSHPAIVSLAKADVSIKPYALRALTDRLGELEGVPSELLLASLKENIPTVTAQSLISLSRLAQASKISDPKTVAETVLPFTFVNRPADSSESNPVIHSQKDANRVIPHLAVNALVSLNATQIALAGIDSKSSRQGAAWVLKSLHNPEAVNGLIARLEKANDDETKLLLTNSLARLYYKEGEYMKGDWWGTRPDTSGPYYDRQKWDQTDRIEKALAKAQTSSPKLKDQFEAMLKRHHIAMGGNNSDKPMTSEQQTPIVIATADPNDPKLIANMDEKVVAAKAMDRKGDAEKGKAFFTSQSCIACHTFADGQTPKGPHLKDIGKRYSKVELVDSILKPNAKIAQGFDSWQFLTEGGQVYTGFVVLESAEAVTIRQSSGVAVEIPKEEIEERKKQENSLMPSGLVNNLTPEQLSDLLAYLTSL